MESPPFRRAGTRNSIMKPLPATYLEHLAADDAPLLRAARDNASELRSTGRSNRSAPELIQSDESCELIVMRRFDAMLALLTGHRHPARPDQRRRGRDPPVGNRGTLQAARARVRYANPRRRRPSDRQSQVRQGRDPVQHLPSPLTTPSRSWFSATTTTRSRQASLRPSSACR